MTARQRQALEYIHRNQRVVTVGPSLKELADHLGVYVFAAQRHVAKLREAGEVQPNKGNGLVATDTYAKLAHLLPATKIMADWMVSKHT